PVIGGKRHQIVHGDQPHLAVFQEPAEALGVPDRGEEAPLGDQHDFGRERGGQMGQVPGRQEGGQRELGEPFGVLLAPHGDDQASPRAAGHRRGGAGGGGRRSPAGGGVGPPGGGPAAREPPLPPGFGRGGDGRG